jgi:hypothetical protein
VRTTLVKWQRGPTWMLGPGEENGTGLIGKISRGRIGDHDVGRRQNEWIGWRSVF